MPIYEYDCPGCGKRSEHLLKNSGDVPPGCPSCGNKGIKKVFSGFSVTGQERTANRSPACSSCPTSACPYSGS